MCQAHTVCKMLVLFDFEYCQGGMEDKRLGCCLFGAILWGNLCTIDCRQRFDMFPWGNSSILRQWRTGDCTFQLGRHHLFLGVGRRDLKIRKKFINKIYMEPQRCIKWHGTYNVCGFHFQTSPWNTMHRRIIHRPVQLCCFYIRCKTFRC